MASDPARPRYNPVSRERERLQPDQAGRWGHGPGAARRRGTEEGCNVQFATQQQELGSDLARSVITRLQTLTTRETPHPAHSTGLSSDREI